jgi:hypothetical protein
LSEQENSPYPAAFMNASGGKVSANFSQFWQVVFQPAAELTFPLTVAVHPFKKPFIYAGFDNLNTDGHGWTRINFRRGELQQTQFAQGSVAERNRALVSHL